MQVLLGIGEELIEAALPALKESELKTVRDVWQRKFGSLPQDAKEKAKQMRFLQSRGVLDGWVMRSEIVDE